MNKLIILLLTIFTLLSCTEDTLLPQQELKIDNVSTQETECNDGVTAIGNYCQSKTCSPNKITKEICSFEIQNSLQAFRQITCDASGSFEITGSCQVQACQKGSIKAGNTCEPSLCFPNKVTNELCTNQISNASYATKTSTCNSAGTDLAVGACLLNSCNNGFSIIDSTCVPHNCSPNSKAQINCVGEIINSKTASKTQTCNSSGTSVSYNSCVLNTCLDGYYKASNTCLKKTCTPNDSTQITCTHNIPNATLAYRSRTCNSVGSNETYGACVLSTCASGYIKSSNICVRQSCTPNQAEQVSCAHSIANSSIAYLTQTCNSSGTASSASTCIAKSCQSGFDLVNNTCIAVSQCSQNQTISCPITNGTGSKTAVCNSGKLGEYGSCNVVSCNAGYSISNGLCTVHSGPVDLVESTVNLTPQISATIGTPVIIATVSTSGKNVYTIARKQDGSRTFAVVKYDGKKFNTIDFPLRESFLEMKKSFSHDNNLLVDMDLINMQGRVVSRLVAFKDDDTAQILDIESGFGQRSTASFTKIQNRIYITGKQDGSTIYETTYNPSTKNYSKPTLVVNVKQKYPNSEAFEGIRDIHYLNNQIYISGAVSRVGMRILSYNLNSNELRDLTDSYGIEKIRGTKAMNNKYYVPASPTGSSEVNLYALTAQGNMVKEMELGVGVSQVHLAGDNLKKCVFYTQNYVSKIKCKNLSQNTIVNIDLDGHLPVPFKVLNGQVSFMSVSSAFTGVFLEVNNRMEVLIPRQFMMSGDISGSTEDGKLYFKGHDGVSNKEEIFVYSP